jgi:kynurenine formamidase
MQIRSFIIAYALVLAILLFADRRPGSESQNRYSHVIDLTDGQSMAASHASYSQSKTRIIAPDALIPGTWTAGQIPPERLVAPLVVMDLNVQSENNSQLSLNDIASWESHHGMIPQGAVVAIRRIGARDVKFPSAASTHDAASAKQIPLPIARDAAMFLLEARYTIGFVVETPLNLSADRVLANQLALHGNYLVEGAAPFTALSATGSLIIVAPAKNKMTAEVPVRILAMVP